MSNTSQQLDVAAFFASIDNLHTVAADDSICLLAGELRRNHGGSLKLPDALHIATAMQAGADTFITDDQSLIAKASQLLTVTSLADFIDRCN